MEVGNREESFQTLGKPLGALSPLAFWTMAITARVVGDAHMGARVATIDVTAQTRGPAIRDVAQNFVLGRRCGVKTTIVIAVRTHDIGHLEERSIHEA